MGRIIAIMLKNSLAGFISECEREKIYIAIPPK